MAVRVLEGGGGEHTENRWGPSESAGGGVLRQSSIAQVREWRVDDAPVRAGRDHERLRSQWPVLIRDHRDGYLGWARPTMFRLAGNRPTPACPLRDGIGAVPGHHRCVCCGKPMRTNYKQRSAPLPRVLRPRPEPPPRRAARSPRLPQTSLAARLNAVGLTTGTRAPFDVKAVQRIPTRLPHPRPEPPTPMGRQCRRGRPPARLQRQRGLRLDQDRQTLHSTRHRQPAAHPLDRARRSPMRPPHHRIRTPQPAGRRTKSRARR